jgi:trehalose synthase
LALGTNSQVSGRSHWNVAAGVFLCPTTIGELSGSHPNRPDWLPFKSALTAEMMNRIVPLLSELEVPAHWEVISGGNDFFEVTKAFHNALQGTPYQLTKHAQEIFLTYSEQNPQRMQFDEELVVIHDPQPAALIQARDNSSARWVWRCHIDLSNPNAQVWDFLRPFVEQFDAAIFSSQSFAR